MGALTPLPLMPPPGVVVTQAKQTIQGRWTAPFDKIRFVNKLPQKVGGNVRLTSAITTGTPRALHAWRDFSQNQYVAIGTFSKLYATDGSYVLTNITPFRVGAAGAVVLTNNPLSTTISTPIVGVVHATHGVVVGDTIIVTGSAAIGGITPNGTFIVDTVVDVNNYTFLFTSNATSTVAAGGGATVAVQYEINVGTEYGAYGQGWGVGSWGEGTWGTARGTSTIFFEPRIWSLDHFGATLLAAYNGGSLYQFDPTQAQPWPRAQLVTAAPTDIRAMFITPERFVFALRDAMIVSASSQSDFNTWTPASSNTAFSRTMQEGTKLVGGRVLSPFVSLVWSDSALFLFQYTGSQFVYNSSLAGKDCGLISPGAAATVDGIAYWMGADNFYTYNGSVSPMPLVEEIRRYVFEGLADQLSYQCHAVYVPRYHEVWFFYPRGMSATNPTDYVIFHIQDQCWSIGTFARSSGTHLTQGDTSPIMGGNDGYLYNHDPISDTFNDNGAAMTWTMTLTPATISKTIQSMELEGIEFSFFEQVGSISATANSYDRLDDASTEDTQTQSVPATGAGITDFRLSGRYLGLTLSASDIDNYMRLGMLTAQVRPTAKRR